ncbi:hypothetical protein A3A71_02650 [Candidatus Berkelbacteria bacterium RIFCSPLOWO2_01_FULL_50_28]|uniref:Glycosyl hydrolase family 32 N-terminal domain-containing protein n=1 Tax=Candidatus Berkelbacteria bacterium RIFCSPLOWO2_01_FULL_50_28 TaxID=1797471 RepID=A0A1F5EC42_9BACT|nr:MAG: hypothetical protein A2807_02140 [Candidatus Berkelbacteria bacterium RIFCSPHIGHO2_01_FULL_50_36]OGD62608.1 MAG: hypothetical protein A3F39_02725 [Candidatus Berkelbacteria bacterium RIFCSPHIGHO2_12_FULL_50_11]OGD64921.1 MAG: hypothetical protein A3A71_02650 [Candidatus Berkelbacteria bacterium RIFCSPLOWO2_01_FULL_50_28]
MNRTIWIIIGVLLVIGIGIGVFFAQKNKEIAAPASTNQTDTTTATPAKTGTWTAGKAAVAGNYADADIVALANGQKRMYYSIEPEVPGNNLEMYSSLSSDGVTWTQESGIRRTMATFPDVIILPDKTFRMYFQNGGVIKSAVSTDGLTWTDESGTRIDKLNDLSLVFDNVAAPTTIIQNDGTYVMVYRGTINTAYVGEKVPNQNTQLFLWATSPDGLKWTKKGLAVDSRNSTLYGLADGPELFVWEDGTIKLSFWSYTGVYWSKFSTGTFSAPEKVFALAEATSMNKFPTPTPGDPVYAKFGSTWYMYYGLHQKGIYFATYGS